jgi:hypothetical protein
LGLLKLKPAPNYLRIVDQTIIKPMGLICDLKICSRHTLTFTILKNNVIDASYSMLLIRPWLRDAKITHDWGNNTMTILRNGTVITIVVTKHLGVEVK